MHANPPALPLSGPRARGVLLADLGLGFLKIGLLGFGGVAAIARHVIVEERRWLTEKEYVTILGVGKVLPGPNTVNAAVIIGDRFRGPPGSVVAVLGLLAMPLVVLIALVTLYDRFATVPEVRAALAGAAAAAAGLVIGTALKMARALRPGLVAIVTLLLACAGVALLRAPLIWIVLILGPLAIAATWLARDA